MKFLAEIKGIKVYSADEIKVANEYGVQCLEVFSEKLQESVLIVSTKMADKVSKGSVKANNQLNFMIGRMVGKDENTHIENLAQVKAEVFTSGKQYKFWFPKSRCLNHCDSLLKQEMRLSSKLAMAMIKGKEVAKTADPAAQPAQATPETKAEETAPSNTEGAAQPA